MVLAQAQSSPDLVQSSDGANAVSGVSVVVPIYNELDNIPRLHEELTGAMRALGKPYELILVDDGSNDGSIDALRRLADENPDTRVILFRRNYGQTSAMKAGIDHAKMDVVVTIDGDLQNDPADIAAMIAKLEEGFDLVHGWRIDRHDSLVNRKIPSRVANWLISRVTHFPIHDLGCTLKATRRSILQEIELYGDMHRFIPILLFQRGARCAEIATHHRSRVAGETKYGISRTITVLLDLVTVKYMLDYSAHPMRLFGGIGLICFAISALSLFVAVGMKLMSNADLTGNPLLLMSMVAGLAGLQLLSLGILGEISARIYYSRDRHTHYAVRDYLNFAPEDMLQADGAK